MLKADKNKWARYIFNIYINRQLKKNFSGFYIAGYIPNIPAATSVIVTPNHISWWDGFFIDYINRSILKRNFYLMMLEEQLSRYSFFRKLGAYSIDPGSTASLRETAGYVREVTKPGTLNVIYPQGVIEPYEKRPLAVKPGLKFFLKNIPANTVVLPAAFKIQYHNKKHPDIICRFGNPLSSASVINNFEGYVSSFYNNLEKLSASVFENNKGTNLF